MSRPIVHVLLNVEPRGTQAGFVSIVRSVFIVDVQSEVVPNLKQAIATPSQMWPPFNAQRSLYTSLAALLFTTFLAIFDKSQRFYRTVKGLPAILAKRQKRLGSR